MTLPLTIAVILLSVARASIAGDFYLGAEVCASCHEAEYQSWKGSHHDLAMAEASESSVLGDFNDTEFTAHGVTSRFYRRDGQFFMRTDGPDGELADFRVLYTFGAYPLQQYLIGMPRGHIQVLGIAWDTRAEAEGGQRWFHLYPDEPMDHHHELHWTSREQTWNYQCAECHSTRLEKNYDVASDSYATTYKEVDVACEACHGPGAEHVAWADAAEKGEAPQVPLKGLSVDLADRDGSAWSIDAQSGLPKRTIPRAQHTQIETCARCHSRRGQIWEDYEYGKPLGNTHRLSLLEERLYHADGQIKDEVFVHGSFIQSKMYQAGVTCNDCHNSHSLELHAGGNAVCASCHLPDRYDTPEHHHHEMGTSGAACTACHMPERVYMVNDWRADHSLRVPRPDLSVSLGTPNACNDCHTDQSAQWAADAVTTWYPDSPHRGPHYAEALHAANTGSAKAVPKLAALAADPAQPGIARATALDGLRDYATPEHLEIIETLLGDEDPLIRAAAVRFLELTEVRTRVDLGWLLLDDPDRAVRLEAVRILAPLLRQRLPDEFEAQLTQAVEEYEQSQRVNAERPESHLNLGLIAVATGNALKAESAYRTAMRLETGFAPAYANLADLYRQLGRDGEGEQLLRAGIDAAPGNADLAHALGLSLVRQQRLDEALDWLRRAVELNRDQPRYAYVYGVALQGTGDLQGAIDVLEEASRRHPGDRGIQQALRDYRAQ